MSDAGLEEYCADRAETSCKTFEYDNLGFTATIDLDRENLVFFTVPWEEGWTAEVNGQPVQIEKANIGFMAVRCPAGENITIRFHYRTPGLLAGVTVTGTAAVVFLLYFFGMGALDRRKRRRLAEMQEESDDFLRDLPVPGENGSGIQYDYYLKDVSIVFPEFEEDVREPAAEEKSPGEERMVDLGDLASQPFSPSSKEETEGKVPVPLEDQADRNPVNEDPSADTATLNQEEEPPQKKGE